MTDATHIGRSPVSAELWLTITRADGTVEEIGQVSGDYRNPLRQLWWRLVGKSSADRRIRAANQRAEALRKS